MGIDEGFIKKAQHHVPAWTIAIMGWLITSPYVRAQLEGDGRGVSLVTALYMAPLMLGLSFVVAIFGSALSTWVMEFYETKIKGGKHLFVWVIFACLVSALFLWVAMNVEVSPAISFTE